MKKAVLNTIYNASQMSVHSKRNFKMPIKSKENISWKYSKYMVNK